jgi:hypothetical protein
VQPYKEQLSVNGLVQIARSPIPGQANAEYSKAKSLRNTFFNIFYLPLFAVFHPAKYVRPAG